MPRLIINALIYLGSALMVYNVYGFIRFTRYVKGLRSWKQGGGILYIPVVLLVLFLLGYLTVGLFGNPDIIMAGILFGGSIFVFIMYRLLSSITQRVVEGEQMEAKLMAVEESQRVKTSFLANISHEMRTPLNVIIGLDGIALRSPELTTETRRQLERIGHSARHLMGMINNILDINRIEDETMELDTREFWLSEMLAQVNSINQTLCDEKGLNYETSIADDAEGRYIGDLMGIKRVLMSILDNAVKYTDAPGTIKLTVEPVSPEGGNRTLRFTVSDTGIGMDREFLSCLFQPLSKEDTSTTSRYGGTGMSLVLAKRLTELRGGTITAYSEKNVGSTFVITFPLEYAADENTAEELGDTVSLTGRRILLAEDIPENAEIVMDLLDLENAEVDHAENGQIALDMFAGSEQNYYDAILMDLRMPVMDGLEATRKIRTLDHPDAGTIPIIALTANAFEGDVQASLDAGMNIHLAKPADSDLLFNALKCQIAIRQNRERGKDQ